MNKRYFIVGNKTRKVVLFSFLLSSMMNSVTQAEDWSNEIIGAFVVAGVTLYATRSYWWPTQEDKNKITGEQTESEQFDNFKSRIAERRKRQNAEVEAAEQQNALRQQAELQKQIETEQSEHADLLKRSTELRKQQEHEVAHHKAWNKIDKAQERESLA